nr:hypothetical protein [Haladaptatus sp. W1]
MARATVYEDVESDRERLTSMAQRIWETPELGLQEEKSAQVLINRLMEEEFDVEVGLGGMPTAFKASYGSGDPTVGILGSTTRSRTSPRR